MTATQGQSHVIRLERLIKAIEHMDTTLNGIKSELSIIRNETKNIRGTLTRIADEVDALVKEK